MKNARTTAHALMTAALLALGACSSSTPPAPQTASGARAAAPQSDGEIVATLAAADRGEISQGNAAQSRATNADVRAFAQSMVSMHTAASAQTSAMASRAGITPTENETSRSLTAAASSTEQSLTSRSGADFDRAYMDAQVTQHQQVLDTVDNALIPNARNPELRGALQNQVRPMVSSHLQQARDIRGRLGSN